MSGSARWEHGHRSQICICTPKIKKAALLFNGDSTNLRNKRQHDCCDGCEPVDQDQRRQEEDEPDKTGKNEKKRKHVPPSNRKSIDISAVYGTYM